MQYNPAMLNNSCGKRPVLPGPDMGKIKHRIKHLFALETGSHIGTKYLSEFIW